jgi:hypothetical protein
VDTAWISAITGLSGVTLGALFARSGEDRKWLRMEQHKATAELLAAGEAMRTIFTDRAVTGLYENPDKSEPNRRKAITTGGERLELALQAFRLVFPNDTAAVAEAFCESARKIRHLRLDSPEVDPASLAYRYFDRRAALTDAARLKIVRPAFRTYLTAKRPRRARELTNTTEEQRPVPTETGDGAV